MQRFVILKHQPPDDAPVHWDLMLEGEDGLMTFRMPEPPDRIAAGPMSLTRIADHPLRFLHYEGPVQKGRGRVWRVDQGTVTRTEQGPTSWDLRFSGHILTGAFHLRLVDEQDWILRQSDGSP